MDLTLSPEQRLLVESARSFLGRACPLAHVRAMEADARGFSAELWREMGRLGWLGLALPSALGGSGQTFLETVLLLEEMGRVLLPSPYLATTVLAAPLLVALADDEQQREWVGAIAAGELVATLALVEPGWRDEWQEVRLEAQCAGDTVRLSGRKVFVPWGPAADLLVVAGAGPSLVVVDARAPDLAWRRLDTDGGEPLYDLSCDDVRVPATQAIGRPGAAGPALERVLAHAAVASLAYMVGAAERALAMTVEHARTRTQFGRPIGSFQAVAHRCVDMRSDVDALRYLVYQAAWCGSAGLEVAAAKAYGNEALRRIFMHAHQVHGAIGFSTEHDLHLFTRRAKATELRWGSASAHRERLARAMGL